MFERLPASHARRLDRRDPVLATLSLLLHVTVAGGFLLASCLALPEISLPRLHPVLSVPVLLSVRGAPAPLLGGQKAAPPSTPASKPPAPDRHTPPSQPREIPSTPPPETAEAPPAGPPADGSTLGPGDPDGVPDGDIRGTRGGICVGPGCDPNGPVGAGPGDPEAGDAPASLIYRPGVDGVTDPVILEASKVLPRYPELARRAGVAGRVILEAVIQPEGTVASVEILRETPPGLGFGEEAAAAVSRWRYRPGTQAGVPVAVYLTVTVDFTLSR